MNSWYRILDVLIRKEDAVEPYEVNKVCLSSGTSQHCSTLGQLELRLFWLRSQKKHERNDEEGQTNHILKTKNIKQGLIKANPIKHKPEPHL